MSQATIRLATERDFEALCRLYHEFHDFHVLGVPDRLRSLEPQGEGGDSELIDALHRIVDGPDSTLFVAEVSGEVVGLAEVTIREDESNIVRVSRRYGHLQSLMVSESFQQHGLGSLLLEAAQRWAKEKGASEMRLDTWEFPAGPLGFYEIQGYRTLRRTLVKEI